MTQIPVFSPKRIYLLIQKIYYENYKAIGKGFLTLLGVFSIILIFMYISGKRVFINQNNFYIFGLIFMGINIAGKAFRDFRVKEKTISYLSLPASALEKLLAELIFTIVLFFISYTIVFYIYQLILIGVAGSFDVEVKMFSLQNENVGTALKAYVLIQSIFFLGAATFRKKPRLSTGFFLFILYILLLICLGIMAKIYPGDLIRTHINADPQYIVAIQMSDLVRTVNIFFFYIIPPVLWTAAYFKLREKEV